MDARPYTYLPPTASLAAYFSGLFRFTLCIYEKICNTPQKKSSVRRSVKQLFSGLIKQQKGNYLEEIFEKLQDIEDTIEIIAREIAQKIKTDK